MTNQTIPELFSARAIQTPHKAAFIYKKDDKWRAVSYDVLAKAVHSFADSLLVLGIKKGDKVAILSENRPEWAVVDLGTMMAGAIVAPLHTTFNCQAIANILAHCEAKILVISNTELLKKVSDSYAALPLLEKIILIEPASGSAQSDKIISWQEFLKTGRENLSKQIALQPDDICSIVYTSGTTGEPKGVLLSHRNFLSNKQAITSIIPISPRDVFLSFLPLSHVLERLAGYYTPLLSGCAVAFAQSPKHLPGNLKEIKPSILISVPRIFEKTYEAIWEKAKASERKKKIFLWALKQNKKGIAHYLADFLVFKKIRAGLGGRLRLTISGGAALNEHIARFFAKIGLVVLEGYGLTETSPVVAVNRQNDFKFGSVGKAIPGVEVAIAKDKEILVKGPNVFSGYYKNEQATREAFDSDGWLKTGDLGFLDKDGFLTIIGRRKEMLITSGGKNIWPEAIESCLNKNNFIASSMVVGDKQKFLGALIAPDWQRLDSFLKDNNLAGIVPEQLIRNDKVLDFFQRLLNETINPKLSDHEKIRAFKLLPRDFSQEQGELTPTLKLRRHIIAQRYRSEIAALFGS